ncbi:hypothetical protein Pint_12695 [Pistacia integerrima]|uniref:Uncharacterized protein n=1 Tax=Pistacia integerrima TaxID=434235 RepID=A0ACC0Y5J5_9ROSI|nr:hypothetical protein Pint_12695 [Pistacia integerrima]
MACRIWSKTLMKGPFQKVGQTESSMEHYSATKRCQLYCRFSRSGGWLFLIPGQIMLQALKKTLELSDMAEPRIIGYLLTLLGLQKGNAFIVPNMVIKYYSLLENPSTTLMLSSYLSLNHKAEL